MSFVPLWAFHLTFDLSCRKQVENSRREAEADGVKVPTTLQEYCQQYKPQSTSSYDLSDDIFDGDDDYYQDSSDNEELDTVSSASQGSEIEEDSGTA